MWIYTGNKLVKFHGNILSITENTAKVLEGLLFLTHTVEHELCSAVKWHEMQTKQHFITNLISFHVSKFVSLENLEPTRPAHPSKFSDPTRPVGGVKDRATLVRLLNTTHVNEYILYNSSKLIHTDRELYNSEQFNEVSVRIATRSRRCDVRIVIPAISIRIVYCRRRSVECSSGSGLVWRHWLISDQTVNQKCGGNDSCKLHARIKSALLNDNYSRSVEA